MIDFIDTVLSPFLLLSALVFNSLARSSTLLLTALMVIGLGFFIRASTKDRIEVMQFGSQQAVEPLEQAVTKYFYSRAFQPTELNRAVDNSPGPEVTNATTLIGMVSPSVFMAVFLSVLAAVGLGCLALIMATLFPAWGSWLLGLVAISPLAGWFYWKKSSRPETVAFKVEPSLAGASSPDVVSILTVKGHRDEIADLQNAFGQPEVKAWAGLKKWEGANQ